MMRARGEGGCGCWGVIVLRVGGLEVGGVFWVWEGGGEAGGGGGDGK